MYPMIDVVCSADQPADSKEYADFRYKKILLYESKSGMEAVVIGERGSLLKVFRNNMIRYESLQ